MEQSELFDHEGPHRRAAAAWMAEHPDAMELYESLALSAFSLRGRERIGIGALTERIRWEYTIERGDEEFKINNNYRAYIARELIRLHPEWKGKIITRATADEDDAG